jgi:hypothetical protein
VLLIIDFQSPINLLKIELDKRKVWYPQFA